MEVQDEKQTITTEQVKAIIKAGLEVDRKHQLFHAEIAEILRKHEGKKPTKRIANDYKKLHPSQVAYWNDEHNMYHLKIWGGDSGRDYSNLLSVLIAYKPCEAVSVEKFEELDACHGSAAAERNARRTEQLNDPEAMYTLVRTLNNFNKYKLQLDGLLDFPMPDQHTIAKLAPTYTKYPR